MTTRRNNPTGLSIPLTISVLTLAILPSVVLAQAYDAKFFGITMPEEIPLSHQERAYTSPIWYTP